MPPPLLELFVALAEQLRVGTFRLDKPLLLWINDGLMAIFFFLVGLELKKELLTGALSSFDRAILPAIAAIHGALATAS